MSSRPPIVSPALQARIAKWIEGSRADSDVKERLAMIIVRAPGDDRAGLPLATVEAHKGEEHHTIAARVVEALVTLASGDMLAPATSWRLYLCDAGAVAIRQGWTVKVSRDDVERCYALAEVRGTDDPVEVRVRAQLDAATAHLLASQAGMGTRALEALHNAHSDVREQSKVTIEGMKAMVGALTSSATMATTAIQAATDRAVAAERDTAAARAELASTRAELKRALELCEQLQAMATAAQDDKEEREKVLSLLTPILKQAVAGAVNGARSGFAG